MFLSLQKREDDHCQNQVHEEELAHNDNHDTVSRPKDWYIGVHHVLKLTIPSVRIDDLIDREQSCADVVKVGYAVVNVGFVYDAITCNVNVWMLVVVSTVFTIGTDITPEA